VPKIFRLREKPPLFLTTAPIAGSNKKGRKFIATSNYSSPDDRLLLVAIKNSPKILLPAIDQI
jgi:hypothetical protein